ncbi:Cyclic dof factor 2 [Sesamum angolense]|uniref:Cyclic dof factor 2 n=1 Tax=Sesamum angolense TaxID=2727404 RepID=A0AAE2BPL9_9LAMI|nr:Cyclic dof factor 2 [Sesamum angolense]
MASVLNIIDKTIMNNSRNGFHTPDEIGIPASRGSKEAGDDCSSRSSAAATSSKDNGKTGLPELMPNCRPFPPQVPCFSGAPWPYPWNSVQWSSPVSPPTFGPASFPVPFYSTATPYWGCAVPGAWNVPWVIPPTHTASQSHTPPSSGPNSPTLGKHSRDDNIVRMADMKDEETRKESNSEKCLWVPKTLRIDDPGEAAKSSIWATLGIKNDRADSGGGGLFKPFQTQSKGDEKTRVSETSTVLQANPAALSRSLSFHESSNFLWVGLLGLGLVPLSIYALSKIKAVEFKIENQFAKKSALLELVNLTLCFKILTSMFLSLQSGNLQQTDEICIA